MVNSIQRRSGGSSRMLSARVPPVGVEPSLELRLTFTRPRSGGVFFVAATPERLGRSQKKALPKRG